MIGFGTLWDTKGLLEGAIGSGGSDPHFVGADAMLAFNDEGGASYSASAKVPVEDMGGPGTADAHWRELVFDNELMTGFINFGTNPLSGVTVASLADLGYTVNLLGADPYSHPRPSLLRAGPEQASRISREGRPETADWRGGDQR